MVGNVNTPDEKWTRNLGKKSINLAHDPKINILRIIPFNP